MANRVGGLEAAQAAISGIGAGQEIAGRAIDLQRRKQQHEQEKLEFENSKWRGYFQKLGTVRSLKKGSTQRKFAMEELKQYTAMTSLPIHEGVTELVDDDDLQVPIAQSIAGILGISDPEKFSEAVAQLAPVMGSPAEAAMQLGQVAAQAQAQQAKAQGKDKSFDRTLELAKFRNSFQVTKDTQGIATAWGSVQASFREGASDEFKKRLQARGVDLKQTAADDLALIFSFMKMLDPGSTVREGEQATAQQARGVPDRVRNLYNEMLKGTKLTPVQRKEFFNTAKARWQQQLEQQEVVDKQVAGLAAAEGLDPSQIIVNFDPSAPTGAAIRKPLENQEKKSKLDARIAAIKDAALKRGFSEEEIDAKLAQMKNSGQAGMGLAKETMKPAMEKPDGTAKRSKE